MGQSLFSTVSKADVENVGGQLHQMLALAGKRFLRLREEMASLPEFLAKFSDLLMRETKGEVALDGRRLGFLHRNLIANRAIELAKAEVFGHDLPDFVPSAQYVVQSSIPVGLNDESHQLSYTHQGKGRTEYVPTERVKEVKRQIANYRRYKELTQEWVTWAIELCKMKADSQSSE